MKRGLTIILELLEKKAFEIDYWPLAFNHFLEFTIEKFNGFSYSNFELLNKKILKLDDFFFIGI
jgi:hypothetical protein